MKKKRPGELEIDFLEVLVEVAAQLHYARDAQRRHAYSQAARGISRINRAT